MTVYYVGSIPYSDELYHYGVPGMKWGVRKVRETVGRFGQSARAAGGAFRSKWASTNPNASKRSKITNGDRAKKEARNRKIKTGLKIGAAVAGTVLAVYGAKKLSDAYSNSNLHINLQNRRRNKKRNAYMQDLIAGRKTKEIFGNARRSFDGSVSKKAYQKSSTKLEKRISKAGGADTYYSLNDASYRKLMKTWDDANPKAYKKIKNYKKRAKEAQDWVSIYLNGSNKRKR